MRARIVLLLCIVLALAVWSEASVYSRLRRSAEETYDDASDAAYRLKRKGEEYADDASTAANRLKRKGQAAADDAAATATDLKQRGQAFAARKKRELANEPLVERRRGWRVPIFGGIADRLRGKTIADDVNDRVQVAKKKGQRLGADAAAKLQQKKREWLESDEELVERHGLLGGIADRFRHAGEDASEAVEDAKQRGRQLAEDVSEKAAQKRREWLGSDEDEADEEEDDEHSGFFGSLGSKLRGGRQDAAEAIDEAGEQLEQGNWWFSKRAGAKLKEANRKFVKPEEDEEEEHPGLFQRIGRKFRRAPRSDLAEKAEDAADAAKQRWWWFSKRAGAKAEQKKRELAAQAEELARGRNRGFFGRFADRFRRRNKLEEIRDDIEDGVEEAKQQGKGMLAGVASKLKRKQREWSEDSDLL